MRRPILAALAPIALALLVLLSNAVSACRFRVTPATIVDIPPPATPQTQAQSKEGYLWAPGYWQFRGNAWHWQDGTLIEKRPGQTYVPGHWKQKKKRWLWIKPTWHRTGPTS